MDLMEVFVMALSLMAVREVKAKPSEPPALRNTSNNTTTAKPEIQKLRLMDGGSNCSGRVELEVMGTWGTVCDDNWDLVDAEVVCQQLGCGSAFRALSGSHFPKGTGPIHLDEVKCLGDEQYLWDCLSNRSHDCGHKEDAGVICLDSLDFRTVTDTTERETVTSVSHLPSLSFTTPEVMKTTSTHWNLRITCIVLGFLLFLSILIIIIILLLNRQKKNDCVISSAPVSVPVLMNHTMQKSTTEGNVSRSLHKIEEVTPSPAHEDSDSDYEDYDFSKKPPVPLSNFYTSLHYQATGDQVSPPHNFPKLTMRQETKHPKDYRQQDPTAEDSDSTSSGDADWYENIHKPQQHVEQQRDEPSFAGEEWMS
ncbi:T-cell differentiation antigen CD6 isoform X3 [Crotalus tigris]|uniref:T-cell differentiation antigen CD6 isoform X3 n=1 Tax=Crotalus tigris TaxID=88082 RepID=UPI00192F5FF5|nr:T-cell differentiation antigen CD6 isoform X3 [Crotalus tigris]